MKIIPRNLTVNIETEWNFVTVTTEFKTKAKFTFTSISLKAHPYCPRRTSIECSRSLCLQRLHQLSARTFPWEPSPTCLLQVLFQDITLSTHGAEREGEKLSDNPFSVLLLKFKWSQKELMVFKKQIFMFDMKTYCCTQTRCSVY